MARAAQLRGLDLFGELRDALGELGYGLEITGEEEAQQRGLGSGIQTWVDPRQNEKTLYLAVAADSRAEDALRWGAAALAKLLGFPPDAEDAEAHALTQAFAYTFAAGQLSTRPALLQLGRIRDRLSRLGAADALDDRGRRGAALQIWAALSPLAARERETMIDRFTAIDVGVGERIVEIDRRWGSLAPATATAAQRTLDQGELEHGSL